MENPGGGSPGRPEVLQRRLSWAGVDHVALAKELEELSGEHNHKLPLMIQCVVSVLWTKAS